MQQTENYALNQWNPEDRILRTDFNADNAKIDAAIAGVRDANCQIKLMHLTLEENTQEFDLDLSELDLTKFLSLTLYAFFKTGSQSSGLNMRCNHISDEVYGSEGNSSNTLGYISTHGENPSYSIVEFVLGPDALHTVSHIGSWQDNTKYYGGQGAPGYSIKLRPDELKSLNFLYTYPSEEDFLLAGSELWLYGRLK